VLIPSLYATNLRIRSLRPVRVTSDQNTRWRLLFHFFPLIKDKNSLLSHIFQDRHTTPDDERWWAIAATPHTCDSLVDVDVEELNVVLSSSGQANVDEDNGDIHIGDCDEGDDSSIDDEEEENYD